MPTFLDLSAQSPNPPRPDMMTKDRPAFRVDGRGLIVMRDPKTITGLGIHQTATPFGPANDRDKAHQRANKVHAHFTIFQDGTTVQGHPLLARMNHGNGLNAKTGGLEFEGLFPGFIDAKNPRVLFPSALESFRFGIRKAFELYVALGCPIKYLLAHRQSSDTRASDPGQEIWQDVVLWAVKELGLETMPTMRFPSGNHRGRPIPECWDRSQKGVRF